MTYGWTGPYCRDIGMDCLGDQQEAIYYFTIAPPDRLRASLCGGRHTGHGNRKRHLCGLVGQRRCDHGGRPGRDPPGHRQLKGSADVYASTVDNTGKLFVHYFTTNCDQLENVPGALENCTKISGMSTIGDPALQGMIMMSLRDYIAPGTARGPDPTKIPTPRILTFTQP